MKMSIALCTYNGEKFLPAQLQSIISQSRLPDEVIICDDRSTDQTPLILRQFAVSAPFAVQVVYNNEAENLGSTRNFERAICLCEGDVIVFSDQDDVWMPDKLAVLEAVLTAYPAVGLVFTDAEVVDSDLTSFSYSLWQVMQFDEAQQAAIQGQAAWRLLLQRPAVTGATMAFRRDFVDILLPIPVSWVHDYWIAMLLSVYSSLLPLRQRTIKYRQHSANQIGVTPKTLLRTVSQTRRRQQEDYLLMRDALLALRERLCLIGNRPGAAVAVETALPVVDGRIAHLESRGMLPASRLQRLPAIGRELFFLRYHRYSAGFRSALRDLLF